MADDLGEVRVKIEQEGAEDAADTIGDTFSDADIDGGSRGGRGGGGGMTIGGLLRAVTAGFSAILAALGPLGVIAAAAGIVLALTPGMGQMIGALVDILSAFLIPVSRLFMTLLEPVLIGLMALLGMWLTFWSDPVGYIMDALNFVWKIVRDIGNWITNKLNSLMKVFRNNPQKIWSFVKRLPQMIWNFMKQLPFMLADQIVNSIPGMGGIDTAEQFSSGVDNATEFVQEQLDINVSGYSDSQIREMLNGWLN